MPLPDRYKVDFSPFRRDLIAEGLERMLSQHYDKCVLRQFVAVFLRECQDLYDSLLDLQEKRTVYMAKATTLDGLGRIVGEDRRPWMYFEGVWMTFDRAQESFDQVPCWVEGANSGKPIEVDDDQYRINIINKAIKNHTLTGSLPELTSFIQRVLDIEVSFEKTGPNTVRLYVPSTAPQSAVYLLTASFTDNRVDEGYNLPYPATLSFSEIVYAPSDWFIFDREDRCFDRAPLAVLGSGLINQTVFTFDREVHGFDRAKTILLQQGA